MLSNNENTALISSPPNEWPQIEVDEKISMASESRFVEKQGHHQNQEQQQQPPQQALRCPRCDSSNTKFCYYNNYSLSQPRHFCKACKRYWTRGGTLRNVPVGGGYYRRNKRVRRPASASSVDEDSSSLSLDPNPTSQPQINISSSSNHVNPLFYGLPGSGSDINLPFSRFNSAGYDNLPPHLSALGLGFSSNLLHNYSNIFGSSASSASDTPTTISSLLASTLNQKKNATYYQTLGSFHGLQMGSNGGETGMTATMKAANIEDGQGRMEWNSGYQNPVEQIGLSDPTVYWNTSNVGAWHDPGNIGSSSVTSLI